MADNVRSFKAVIDETLGKAGEKCVSDISEAKGHLKDLDKKLASLVFHSHIFWATSHSLSGRSINNEVGVTHTGVSNIVAHLILLENKAGYHSSDWTPAGRGLCHRRDVRAGSERRKGCHGKSLEYFS